MRRRYRLTLLFMNHALLMSVSMAIAWLRSGSLYCCSSFFSLRGERGGEGWVRVQAPPVGSRAAPNPLPPPPPTPSRVSPRQIQGQVTPHAIVVLPKTDGMEMLLCYEDEGVYVNTYGRITKDVVLQWGEMPTSVGTSTNQLASP